MANWLGGCGLALLLSPLVVAIVFMHMAIWRESKLKGAVLGVLMLGAVLFIVGYLLLPSL